MDHKNSNDFSKIIINTNRGKVIQKINLNKYYLLANDFTNETSEYYD